MLLPFDQPSLAESLLNVSYLIGGVISLFLGYYVVLALYKTLIYYPYLSPYVNLPSPPRKGISSLIGGNIKESFANEPGLMQLVRFNRYLLAAPVLICWAEMDSRIGQGCQNCLSV